MQVLMDKSQQVNQVVKTVVQVKTKVIERQHNVIKTIIEHDANVIDKQCTINDTAWLLYNRATQDPLAQSASEPYGAESEPQAASSEPTQAK